MIKNAIAYNNDLPWVFQIKKAQDEFIWDQNNKRYIDFTSGWNVANLGFNHPEITQAVIAQAKENHYSPMWASEAMQEAYASELIKTMPPQLNTVCRSTSGTEANEIAIKIARAATGRKKIIGFSNAYHGQSLATMALCFSAQSTKKIGPMPPDFIQISFPERQSIHADIQEQLSQFYLNLEQVLSQNNVAAIVLEACMVTGSGTAYVTESSFLKKVRQLTQKYGTLMILDEVGTGFGRCGALFAHQLYDVVPDILTLAKAITNGAAAMGAVLVNDELMTCALPHINITSTFGWTPIACAAASASLNIHLRDKVYEHANNKGRFLLKTLEEGIGNHPKVGNIQGIGLEIGVTFVHNLKERLPDNEFAFRVVTKALERGLHVTNCSQHVIQLMPPLIIREESLHEGMALFIQSINELDA